MSQVYRKYYRNFACSLKTDTRPVWLSHSLPIFSQRAPSMPAKLRSVSIRPLSNLRKPEICARCLYRVQIQSRNLSTSRALHEEESRQRWAHTPERMKAPISMNFHNKDQRWPVNESPEKLDEFYTQLIGDGGSELLSEEVKWLAMTHKTFDQGRRGYNDRLAFFGRIHVRNVWA